MQTDWQRIVRWCQVNTPLTAAAIRSPAATPNFGGWPEELRVWFGLHDGTERSPAGYLLPGYRPLPIAEAWSRWAMRQEDPAEPAQPDPYAAALGGVATEPAGEVARLNVEPAGTPAGVFLPAFIPIAEDQSGADLFVDTRPGLLSNCVTEFVPGNADAWGPRWPSLAALLREVADGLDSGRIGSWRPLRAGGLLDWVVD